ncbi:MAG TPA: zinc-dependent alcohol dehydrogenase family protein [Actinocrinis sp.]|nr:zinc-dependent alcohol dehydrogenase family protein [Actinocrinis sp.]
MTGSSATASSEVAASSGETMEAWAVHSPGPISTRPLRRVRRPVPEPGAGDLLVRVEACGVCRTDLHLAEGDLPPRAPGRVPGHEVVGTVVSVGADTAVAPQAVGFVAGDRVGIAWLGWTCGVCRYCRRGAENLCPQSRYTGWDVDGGYAEYAVVDAAYAYRLPGDVPAAELAPLLCAGIIGYRALKLAELPRYGTLGLYGFGASAHITAQLALASGATVHVVTRSTEARRLALDLGAASAGEAPPEPLDSAIIFAPAGGLVPVALETLDRGGTLAIAGIHLSPIPGLDYDRQLFQERTLRSVTANTRADGHELLALAEQSRPRLAVTRYAMNDADKALADLAGGRVTGVAVLVA